MVRRSLFTAIEVPCGVVGFDMQNAVTYDPEGGLVAPGPVHRVFRAPFGGTGDGLTVFDYRSNTMRGAGSLARIRVMRVRHGTAIPDVETPNVRFHNDEYECVVLGRPVDCRAEPGGRLLTLPFEASWRLPRKEVLGGNPVWKKVLPVEDRTRRKVGGTVLAIVDDQNALAVREDHLLIEHDLRGEKYDENEFLPPDGNLRPSILVSAGNPRLLERLREQDLPVRMQGETARVGLRPGGFGWELPERLPEGVTPVLDASEGGGAMKSVGRALVPCGLHGEALPLLDAGTPLRPCGTHGAVAGGEIIHTVLAEWDADTPRIRISIDMHRLEKRAGEMMVRTDRLRTDFRDELPAHLGWLAPAIDAAVGKVKEYHSQKIWFSA